MKKQNWKKILMLLAVAVLSIAAIGCSQKDGTLSEDEYITAVNKANDEATALYTEVNEQLANATEADATQASKDALEQMKTIYTGLGELKAPEKYQEAQTKIKAGCDAYVKMVDILLEISSFDMQNLTDEDYTKMEDLQKQMADLQPALEQLNDGLTSIPKAENK